MAVKMVLIHTRIEEANVAFLDERKKYYGLESRNAVLNLVLREARLAAEKEAKGATHGNDSRKASASG